MIVNDTGEITHFSIRLFLIKLKLTLHAHI